MGETHATPSANSPNLRQQSNRWCLVLVVGNGRLRGSSRERVTNWATVSRFALSTKMAVDVGKVHCGIFVVNLCQIVWVNLVFKLFWILFSFNESEGSFDHFSHHPKPPCARPNLAAIIKNRHLPYKSGACLRRGGFAYLKRAPISARMFDFYCYTNNPQAFTSAAAKLEHFWSTPTHPLLSRTKDLGASIFRVIIIVIFYFTVGDSSCWNLRLLPARALCVCGWHWAVL